MSIQHLSWCNFNLIYIQNEKKGTTKEKKTLRTVSNSTNNKQIPKKCLSCVQYLRIFHNLVRHLASSTRPSLFLLRSATA